MLHDVCACIYTCPSTLVAGSTPKSYLNVTDAYKRYETVMFQEITNISGVPLSWPSTKRHWRQRGAKSNHLTCISASNTKVKTLQLRGMTYTSGSLCVLVKQIHTNLETNRTFYKSTRHYKLLWNASSHCSKTKQSESMAWATCCKMDH